MIRITTESPSSLRYCHDQTESPQNRHPASYIAMVKIAIQPQILSWSESPQNHHPVSSSSAKSTSTTLPQSQLVLSRVDLHQSQLVVLSSVDIQQSRLVLPCLYTRYSWLLTIPITAGCTVSWTTHNCLFCELYRSQTGSVNDTNHNELLCMSLPTPAIASCVSCL